MKTVTKTRALQIVSEHGLNPVELLAPAHNGRQEAKLSGLGVHDTYPVAALRTWLGYEPQS